MAGLDRRGVLRLAGAAGVAAVAGCGRRSWEDLPGTRLVLATGNPGGVFHRYGDALATVLTERLTGLTVTTLPTAASVENVRLVAEGAADLALSLADTAADAMRGTGAFTAPTELSALVRTYDSYVHLVVRADSPIDDVQNLLGRRVGLGAVGSGTNVLARRILREAGVATGDVVVDASDLGVAARRLRAGRLDAFFFVSGIPNSAVADLARRVPIRLVELERWAPALVSRYGPEYVSAPVPLSVYDLPVGIDTVSVKNYVLARPGLPADVAYAVTRVMLEDQSAVDRLAPGVRQPTTSTAIFTSPIPLHPGARRYFRESQM